MPPMRLSPIWKSLRMAVLIAGAVGLVTSVMALYQVERERRIDIEDVDRRAHALEHQLAFTVREALARSDAEVPRALRSRLEGYRQLIGFAVYRPDGRLVASAKAATRFTEALRDPVSRVLLGGQAEVLETQRVVDALVAITGVLRTIGLGILIMVGLTVLFIVVNTIRMAVMARADEIEIMRLVGASDAFIRWPFIFEGALVGLLGAVITMGLLFGASEPIARFMFDFFRVLPLRVESMARDVGLLVVITGVGLGVVGSWMSVRTYLAR